jgi:AraC family transcriptional regulator, melibiose operon regulatory protein
MLSGANCSHRLYERAMLPFSLVRQGLRIRSDAAFRESGDGRGYEFIAFDASKFHMFAAEVRHCEPHWHSAPELIYVLEGEFVVSIGERLSQLPRGGIIYVPPEDIHTVDSVRPGSSLVTVQFAPQLFDDFLLPPRGGYVSTSVQRRNVIDCEVRKAFACLVREHVQGASVFSTRSAVYRLLAGLERAGQDSPAPPSAVARREAELVKECMKYLSLNPEMEISMANAAAIAGVSYFYFSKIFKKVSGHNFKEYVTLLRTNRAKLLLKNPDITITDISHMSGFKEHKHLISAFRKHLSMTPSEYRKLVGAGVEQRELGGLVPDVRCLPLDLQIVQRVEMR